MEFSDENLQRLITSPTEQLDIELKPWLDLSNTKRFAEVLECCMALWNTNGGVLVIGFNDKTRKPDTLPDGFNLDQYRDDKILSALKKHASYQFEVKVRVIGHEGIEHPVVCVGSGVKYPVACKTEIHNPNNDKEPFLARNAVYVRSFNNGAVGTTKVLPDDWQRVTGIWFRNQEADVGAFLKKYAHDSSEVGRLRELQRRFVAAQDRFPRELSFALAMIPHEERRAWTEANKWYGEFPPPQPKPANWRCVAYAEDSDTKETVMLPASENDGPMKVPRAMGLEHWKCWLLKQTPRADYPATAINMFHSLASDACRKLEVRTCGELYEDYESAPKPGGYQHLLRWSIEQLSGDGCQKMTWMDPPNEMCRATLNDRSKTRRWLVEMPCVFAAVATAIEKHLLGRGRPWPVIRADKRKASAT